MRRIILNSLLSILLVSSAAASTEPDLLQRAAGTAMREVATLSELACTERVIEVKFNQKQKVEETRSRTFDYFVLVDTEDGELGVMESRLEQREAKSKEEKSKEAKPLLLSTGFATLMLILHPWYQDSFTFTDLGMQEDRGKSWHKFGFGFIAGKKSPGVLRVGTREYPLSWTGEFLMDEPGGHVSVIRAHLGAPLDDIGLESLNAEVRYGPAQLVPAAAEWVPLSATVELRTRHQSWRNTHTFTNYKRFDVSVAEKKGTPQ